MKYFIALLVVGMYIFTACGGDTITDEPANGELVDNTDTQVNPEPEVPDTTVPVSSGQIDESIIGEDSGIDTDGVQELINNW